MKATKFIYFLTILLFLMSACKATDQVIVKPIKQTKKMTIIFEEGFDPYQSDTYVKK